MTAPAFMAPELASPLTASADTMEQTIRASMVQTLGAEPPVTDPAAPPADPAAQPEPKGIPGRDPVTGKFVAAADQPPVDGAPTDPAPAPEVVIPEGYVAAEPLPEERIKGFSVEDAEGEIIPPNLTWKFDAGGKPRAVDTAGLLEYARMGVYNHEREQGRVQTEQQNHQLQSRAREAEEQTMLARQEVERLLSDPNYLVAAIQRYERENTPEARADRARQQIQQEREQFQLERMAVEADAFVDNTLTPAVDLILGQLTTISQDEIAHRLFLVGDRYRVSGVLSPEGFGPMQRALVEDILPWAQQLHAHRMSERQLPVKDAEKQKAEAKAREDAARVRAQKARRAAVSPLQPVNGQVPSGHRKPNIANQKDVQETVISQTLGGMRATG